MLSVSPVRSASGAANYFAKDNYYTASDAPTEHSAWGGEGASRLGLKGEVSKADFEQLLNGRLPDGTIVNANENKRAGTDLTFSMPKSASVLAYVAGDQRILDANQRAVAATMSWAEKHFAEGRTYERSKSGEAVKTGNLTYAMFQHDTSRKLDPQAHIHVVIANLTQMTNGKWQALRNDQLYSNNTAIGSAYHAQLRDELAKIGYQTELTGKHGQFEIKGVPQPVIDAFSQRRAEILAKVEELGITTPQGQDAVTVGTRDNKINIEDRGALQAEWQSRAQGLGFDGKQLVADALAKSAPAADRPVSTLQQVRQIMHGLRDTLSAYLKPRDSLVTNGADRLTLTPSQIRTELAVASAIRHLGQREAAFTSMDVYRSALDLGLSNVTAASVDQRIAALLDKGALIPGKATPGEAGYSLVTTPDHIRTEKSILAEIDRGRAKSEPVTDPQKVQERLQAYAGDKPLNAEQLAAATLSLTTSDRVAIIQGVAGAGKTHMLQALARTAEAEGREVVGLAQANKMVGMLREETKIEANTVASFLGRYQEAGEIAARTGKIPEGRSLEGKLLLLDESSLVSNDQTAKLLSTVNALKADRLVMIGDRKQLQPIDAGKAFSLVQRHDPNIAFMSISQRQRTEEMKAVAGATGIGNFRQAFAILGDKVVSADAAYVAKAAERWLSLSPEQREKTALYASGRAERKELNELVQSGLKTEGTLKGPGAEVTTLQQVHATREEMRYARTYASGMIVEVRGNKVPGLDRGRYTVASVDQLRGRVTLQTAKGREVSFRPDRIDHKDTSDRIGLFEKQTLSLHEGDRIRWTANDKTRELYNSSPARVLEANADKITVLNEQGKTIELKAGDKMLERLNLSYAINMHQAQGMTSDHGIGVMLAGSGNLSNQRLAHVMATRVRDGIEVFTDDKDKLLRTIERSPGDKFSALEATGRSLVDTSGTQSDRKALMESLSPAKERDQLREPLRQFPERNMELGL